MFSRPKILFLVSLLFVALLNPKFNPYLPFKFLIFYHSSLRNNYACLQALVNNALTWQSSCVIANNARKTAKAICPRL